MESMKMTIFEAIQFLSMNGQRLFARTMVQLIPYMSTEFSLHLKTGIVEWTTQEILYVLVGATLAETTLYVHKMPKQCT